jgi:hypothetical protein
MKTDGEELITAFLAGAPGGCSTAIEIGELTDSRRTSEIFIGG